MPKNTDTNNPSNLGIAKDPEILMLSLTARGRFGKLLGLTLIVLAAAYGMHLVPAQGFWLDQAIGLHMRMIHYHFTAGQAMLPFKIMGAIPLLYIIHTYLYAKFTKIRITPLIFEITEGVLAQETDTINLITVRDPEVSRTVLDRMLGISHFNLISRDKVHPSLKLIGLRKSDAVMLKEFMQNHAFQSYTEFRIAKDIRKGQNFQENAKPAVDADDEADDKNYVPGTQGSDDERK